MALFICPECGCSISDTVLKCPKCGCPRSFFVATEANSSNEPMTNEESVINSTDSSSISIVNKPKGGKMKKALLISICSFILILLGCLVIFEIEVEDHVNINNEAEYPSILNSAYEDIKFQYSKISERTFLDVISPCKTINIRWRFSTKDILISRTYTHDGYLVYDYLYFIKKYIVYNTIFGIRDKVFPIYKASGDYREYEGGYRAFTDGTLQIYDLNGNIIYKRNEEYGKQTEYWSYYPNGVIKNHGLSRVTGEKEDDIGETYFEYETVSNEWFTEEGVPMDYWTHLFKEYGDYLIFKSSIYQTRYNGDEDYWYILLRPWHKNKCTQGDAIIVCESIYKNGKPSLTLCARYEYEINNDEIIMRNGQTAVRNSKPLRLIREKIIKNEEDLPAFEALFYIAGKRVLFFFEEYPDLRRYSIDSWF